MGAGVGGFVGKFVGGGVGAFVGAGVGLFVGKFVGAGVGGFEGAGVGCITQKKMQSYESTICNKTYVYHMYKKDIFLPH